MFHVALGYFVSYLPRTIRVNSLFRGIAAWWDRSSDHRVDHHLAAALIQRAAENALAERFL